MDDLKPCPFCGGEAALDSTKGPTRELYEAVICSECGASGPCSDVRSMQDDEAHPIDAWNARPAPDTEGIINALSPRCSDASLDAAAKSIGFSEWAALSQAAKAGRVGSAACDSAIAHALTLDELQRLREVVTRAEAAFSLIAGSHWERFGIDQTDVEQVPDLSSDEAMNVARDFLAYDDFPATSQEQRHD